MAGNDPLRGALALPFKEQVEFFAQKINLPTAHWDDIRQGAHDRAFVVAGAMKADLLADLKQSIARHMDGGLGLEGYRRDFYAIIRQYGWQGFTGDDRKKPSDPKDKGGAGMAWRTRVTYMTNLRTSYAAGRYQQLKESPSLRYWMWKHDPLVTEARAQHLAWDGMILPADHPFWKLHYPPQIPPHWGCRCRVVGVEAPDDAIALGGDPDKALPEGWEAIDATHKTQAPGWDYAPGAHAMMPLREMVERKLIDYPPAISGALSRDINRYINATSKASAFAARVLDDRSVTEDLWLGFPDNHERIRTETGRDVKGFAGILPADVPRHVQRSHGHDGGDQRPVTAEDYDRAWGVLTEADRIAPGGRTVRGLDSIVAWKGVGEDTYRAVFEVRPGRKTRLLALVSLVVKTGRR